MNKIEETFLELKRKGEKALIPFFTAGFPSAGKTVELVKMAEKSGADMVELGVPFSDPVADGPIIQYTSFKALDAGINTDKIFEICAELQKTVRIPYLLMSYYNPLYRYGLQKFVNRCEETGVSGLIIPDIPYEEMGNLRKSIKKHNIKVISFITPFTSLERAGNILKEAEGFIYFVTIAGVTGPKGSFGDKLAEKIQAVREITDIPVAAGFGVSGVKQINMIKGYVEGVIVGSFFARKIIDGKTDRLWPIMRRFKRALTEREKPR